MKRKFLVSIPLAALLISLSPNAESAKNAEPDTYVEPSVGFSRNTMNRDGDFGSVNSVNYGGVLRTTVLDGVKLRIDGTIHTNDYRTLTGLKESATTFSGGPTVLFSVGEMSNIYAAYELTDRSDEARVLEGRDTKGHRLIVGTDLSVGKLVFLPLKGSAKWYGNGNPGRREVSGSAGVRLDKLFANDGLSGSFSVEHTESGIYNNRLTNAGIALIYGTKEGTIVDLLGYAGQINGVGGSLRIPLRDNKKAGDARLALTTDGKYSSSKNGKNANAGLWKERRSY